MLTSLILAAALLAPQVTTVQTPVGVDAYHGNYESQRSASEQNFDSGILSAFQSKQGQSGQMEGSWTIADVGGKSLVALEMRADPASDSKLSAAWRSMQGGYGITNSGFVSSLIVIGRDMEINYFPGRQRSPNILRLHKDGDNVWRGTLMDIAGQMTPVTLTATR